MSKTYLMLLFKKVFYKRGIKLDLNFAQIKYALFEEIFDFL